MGKHRKIINDDPILQKDYKYQKRKKERALQRESNKIEEEKRREAEMELEMIREEVDQEIQRELQGKIKPFKTKSIVKPSSKLFTRPSQKSHPSNHHKMLQEHQQTIKLKTADNYQQQSLYHHHFHQQKLGVPIRLENKEYNKKQQIDRQVRAEIKDIFGVEEKEEMEEEMSEDDNNQKQKINRGESQYKKSYVLEKSEIKEVQNVLSITDANNQEEKNTFLVSSNCQPSAIPIINHNILEGIIKSYHDLIYIEGKEQSTIEDFRKLVLEHMVTHEKICSTPKLILKSQQNKEVNNQQSKGFTNARSLILTPFFGDARAIIQLLQDTWFSDFQAFNKEKIDSDEIDDQNDFFRIGIRINPKKKTIKYFNNFNTSNIIIASPVGLKAIVGSEGDKNRDTSFLSSIEILYIDRVSTILMQNWDHLIQVLKVINQLPEHDSICNSIDQLRPSATQLKSKLYRQSILFSQFNFAEINAIKHQFFHNWQGILTNKLYYPYPTILSNTSKIQKQFYKFQIQRPSLDLELRFNFFKNKFWDELYSSEALTKTVIMTRTYFQFVKLKDYFMKTNASAQCISEFTKKPKVQSHVSNFNAHKFKILLLTERAYYYNICRIKKFNNLYFYSLPQNQFVFTQLLKQLMASQTDSSPKKNKSVILYNKYDYLILERIVGTKKGIQMIKQYCANVSFML